MRKELLLIGLMILMSGCTSSGPQTKAVTSEGSYGVIIDEFSSDLSVIEEGDTATLLLSFSNVDNEIATDLYAKLYAVGLTNADDTEKLSELEPNNTEFFEFDVTAPKGLNIDRDYTPYVDFCYNYKARASTSVFVVDQDVYDAETVPALSSSSSYAPVQMELSFSSDVVKIDQDDELGKDKTLNIELTNVDSGNLYNGTSDKDGEENYLKAGGLLIRAYTTGDAILTIKEEVDGQDMICATSESAIRDSNGNIVPGYTEAYGISTNPGNICNLDVQSCTTTADCEENTCDITSGTCGLTKKSCTSEGNSGCSSDTEDVCVGSCDTTTTTSCTEDDDCPSGETCSFTGGKCTSSMKSCSDDSTCSSETTGDVCVGYCSVTFTVECSSSNTCASNTCEEGTSSESIYCTNLYDVSFGSKGDHKTLRLPINFEINENGQDIPFFIGVVDYRYCLLSDQITISAQRIT